MSLKELINHWRADDAFMDCVESWRVVPKRPGDYLPIPENIHPVLRKSLQSTGINQLYSHQVETWNLASAGKNVVIVTGTASGKTLSYNLPVLHHLLCKQDARALYIYPTKALSQDQKSALSILTTRINLLFQEDINPQPDTSLTFSPLIPAIYDGDTPSNQRPTIRSSARLLITNPDMLHLGIMPHHTSWAEFFSHIRFIIIDEIHVYRGVFGSHVANMLRRLKRIAAFYGSFPQFLLTSATIANPLEIARRLVEEDAHLVDQDGSPRGEKHFVLYNPPVIDPELGLRRGLLHDVAQLSGDSISFGAQTIIFGRSRRTVELLVKSLRESPAIKHLSVLDGGVSPSAIRGYRSGYLPRRRREIETQLRQGSARAVVATNALELGIDIGDMSAALLAGYPGSIASTLQQAGRSGRKEELSLAVLVASSDPLDQFIARHPEFIFEKSPEYALIDPDNLLILVDHIRCASFEIPFSSGDGFGNLEPGLVSEFLKVLESQGYLHETGRKYFWMSAAYPSQEVSLRNISGNNVALRSESDELSETIGVIDRYSAYWMVHTGAVYFHESESYLVRDLDLEENIAHLFPLEVDYYTETRKESDIQLIEKLSEKELLSSSSKIAQLTFGEILVTEQVVGFKKIKLDTHENLGEQPLDLPSVQLSTKGAWLALPEDFVGTLKEDNLWLNEANDYGPDWPKIKAIVRERDEYRCQVCGAPENDRAHAVHHKVPFRSYASHQEANRLDNLITLCPRCHQRVETNVRIRSGLAGLGYIIRHLAPFLLMCDARDLGVQSDPKSPLADGAPVVVVYDQFPGGIGLSQHLFELFPQLICNAREAVLACECKDGCPSCVGPGGENGLGSKKETLAILENLV